MGAYNRTSRPAGRPPKIYLPQPVPAAGVEEGASVEEGAGVEELFYSGLFYTSTLCIPHSYSKFFQFFD